MDTQTSLSGIIALKTTLANNLTTKGVPSLSTNSLTTLVNNVLDIPAGPGAIYGDWLDISDVVSGNIALLVNDTGLATYAFFCTTDAGQYNIDWGDGTSLSYDSGVTAQHSYSPETGTLSNIGYQMFKVTISPSTGNNLLTFGCIEHDLNTNDQYFGILGAFINSTTLTSLYSAFNSDAGSVINSQLVYCSIINGTSITDLSYAFSLCSSLALVSLDTPIVVNLEEIFYGCTSFPMIELIGMNLITNIGSGFARCRCLKMMDLSQLSSLETITGAFAQCSSLIAVNLSNLTSLTASTGVISLCDSLAFVNLSNSAFTNTMLNEIFTDLPTVAGMIIITGTTGEMTCDKTIATLKGWSVTGGV